MSIKILYNATLFLETKDHKNQLQAFLNSDKKTYVISLFTPIRYLILLQMASYFSEPNNVKYLFPSLILRNTILLSSLIHSTHNICSFIISLHVRRESPIVLVKYCCNYMQWDSKLFFFFHMYYVLSGFCTHTEIYCCSTFDSSYIFFRQIYIYMCMICVL